MILTHLEQGCLEHGYLASVGELISELDEFQLWPREATTELFSNEIVLFKSLCHFFLLLHLLKAFMSKYSIMIQPFLSLSLSLSLSLTHTHTQFLSFLFSFSLYSYISLYFLSEFPCLVWAPNPQHRIIKCLKAKF